MAEFGFRVTSESGNFSLESGQQYRELGQSYELTGDSVIIDPRGEVMAGPAKGETILLAQCNQETLLAAKSVNDVGGHYSRPDIFQLHVNEQLPHRVRRLEANSTAPVAVLVGPQGTSHVRETSHGTMHPEAVLRSFSV